ncbi:MAG: sigma-70 family RNA polymerase sigma factor [Actinomycetota bacterium]
MKSSDAQADETARHDAPPKRARPAGAETRDDGIEVDFDVPARVTAEALTFEAFYAEHHAPVARALALTLGDTGLGVEAADEAMTRAYQRWSQVAGYANPAGWVYRVGLNWARSFLRRRRRTTSSPYIEEAPVEDPQPTDPSLARALAALDPKHRSVVVLRYLLDWSVDQTAEALDIAPGTVKSRLHRALAQLETHMSAATREQS